MYVCTSIILWYIHMEETEEYSRFGYINSLPLAAALPIFECTLYMYTFNSPSSLAVAP